MKNLEALKEIIIKENPEIMELKTGCKTDYGTITKIEGIELRLNGGTSYISKEQVKKGVVKIIGRDITLEDVLIVLTQNGGNRWDMITYKNGKMSGKIQILRDNQEKFIDWQLGKPLHEQSEETIKFLLEILDK